MKVFLTLLLSITYNFIGFSQIDHWETVVYNSDTWQYFVGNSEPPATWMLPSFNDNSWKSGKGGIGYGDGDDRTIIEPTYSLYIRTAFTITDIAAIESLILQADYDDAFVAYLNGIEIARANVDGLPPAFNQETFTDHEATLYSSGSVESFFLSKENIEDLLVNGENVLAISIHNRLGPSSSDMTANFFLTVGINNNSSDYRPTLDWFTVPTFESELPIIRVSTDQGINSTTAVLGDLGVIHNQTGDNSIFDTANEYEGAVSIKFRGQSSLSFPKKNYSIELKDAEGNDLDTSFLGFPKEEDFILHGPYSDKSLMRNVLVMDLARKMGQYASKTRYVDFYLNGSYQGIYVLMEKIKRDKDRVDVAKLREVDIAGDELTGGYIFKIDKGTPDWLSRYNSFRDVNKLRYQLVYPDIDRVQPEQFAYIQSYVDSFERAMVNPNLVYGGKSFDEYIDLTSFAEAHLLNELGKNVDGYRLSSYFHKKKDSNGGKIYAGPVWDFNLAFRNADYCDGWMTGGLAFERLCDGGYPFWWDVLLRNEKFQSIVRCRWDELRATSFRQDSIFAFIDAQVETLTPSLDNNFSRWNIFGLYVWPNPQPLAQDYQGEIQSLKGWLSSRLAWMDVNIGGTCEMVTSTENLETTSFFKISPNPTNSFFTLSLAENIQSKVESIHLIDALGKRISLINSNSFLTGDFTYDISTFNSGVYFVEIVIDRQSYVQKLIIQ